MDIINDIYIAEGMLPFEICTLNTLITQEMFIGLIRFTMKGILLCVVIIVNLLHEMEVWACQSKEYQLEVIY